MGCSSSSPASQQAPAPASLPAPRSTNEPNVKLSSISPNINNSAGRTDKSENSINSPGNSNMPSASIEPKHVPECLNLKCRDPGSTEAQPDVCKTCGTSLLIHGRFRVISSLQHGGFGRTLIGWDLKSPTHSPANPSKVVVKQFTFEVSNPEEKAFCKKAKDLFIKEAVQLEKLGDYKNIPTMLEHTDETDGWLIVQEFIDGVDCFDDTRNGWEWTEAKLLVFLKSVLTTLAYVHAHHVIHRDIKPENIMRRTSDGDYVLIDFGAAKEVTREMLLNKNTAIGTVGYIAPEIGRGECYYNSDLYSLAATVVYFMTRMEPTQILPSIKYYKNFLKIPISVRFASIIDAMLSFDPRSRPLHATDVLKHFESM